MYPRGLHVDVKIYAKDRDLQRHYRDIFKESKDYKSFYIILEYFINKTLFLIIKPVGGFFNTLKIFYIVPACVITC